MRLHRTGNRESRKSRTIERLGAAQKRTCRRPKKEQNAERKTLPGQHCHQPQSALHLIPATPHKLHFCTQKKNGEIKQHDSDKRRNRKHVHTAIDVMSAYYIILIGK